MSLTWNGRPAAIGTNDAWTLGAGSSKVVAVDPGDPVAHDDDTTYISKASGAAASKQSFTLLTTRPTLTAVTSVSLGIRFKIAWVGSAESLTVFAILNGVEGTSVTCTAAASNVWQTTVGALARPGGGGWTVPDILNSTLQICVANPAALNGAARVSSLYMTVVGEPVPRQISQARDIGTRRLLAFRRETGQMTPKALAQLLDAELLDEIGVAHFAIPMHAALGGGLLNWQRITHRLTRADFNLDNMYLQPVLKDVRNQLVQFIDVGRSLNTSGPTLDGIARMDPGCTRTWTRATKAWVTSPADGKVHECRDGEEKIDASGQLLESARTNSLIRSSFISQLTGWTVTAGLGTSATASASEPSIFEDGITGYVLALATNAGSAGSEVAVASTACAFAGSAKISASMDYRENAAATALKVRITRSVDGRYWDGAAWQVAVQNLAVTASTVDARAMWENIDVGAGATNIVVTPVLQGAAGSKSAFVKHVQVELGAWASTRIVTDAAAVTRALDSLKVSDLSAARCWNRDRGTVWFKYRPFWGPSAPATAFYLFDVTYDANNWFRAYYDWAPAGVPQLKFEVRVSGTTYTATSLFTATRGTIYSMALRWSSSSAELGLAAYTVSVFVNGVKGTDVVATGMPGERDTDMYIGGNSGVTLSADGSVYEIFHTQQVLTDAEISRGF